MRHVLLALPLLLNPAWHAGAQTASCQVEPRSILSRSADGLPQVSNLSYIEVKCSIPARPIPTKPGEGRNGLTAQSTALVISPNSGEQRPVPSDAASIGGGSDGQTEWVNLDLFLPLDPADRQVELRRSLEKMFSANPAMFPESKRLEMLAQATQIAGDNPNFIPQHRSGRFSVQIRILDETRVVGTGNLQLEVRFKGRFSDGGGLPGYWQAPPPATAPPSSTPHN